MQRIQIRNKKSQHAPGLHLMDALVEEGEIYLELKIQRFRERIPLMDIMRQIHSVVGKRSCRAGKVPQPCCDCPCFSRKTE